MSAINCNIHLLRGTFWSTMPLNISLRPRRSNFVSGSSLSFCERSLALIENRALCSQIKAGCKREKKIHLDEKKQNAQRERMNKAIFVCTKLFRVDACDLTTISARGDAGLTRPSPPQRFLNIGPFLSTLMGISAPQP